MPLGASCIHVYAPRGSGSACESGDGDDSDGQGAPQGGGDLDFIFRLRAKHPRLGPRSGNFAGLKGSRGHFHEKIGASFYNPNCQNPAVSCLMFFLACVYGARGRHHTAQMESWTTASVECVETCAFFRGQKNPKSPQNEVRTHFSPHRCSILSRRAWRVAPAAA